LSDNTKKINQTVIIAGRAIYTKIKNKGTERKKKIEEELEKKPEKDLGGPLPNQKSLIPSVSKKN
jgi:hypothetical protein